MLFSRIFFFFFLPSRCVFVYFYPLRATSRTAPGTTARAASYTSAVVVVDAVIERPPRPSQRRVRRRHVCRRAPVRCRRQALKIDSVSARDSWVPGAKYNKKGLTIFAQTDTSINRATPTPTPRSYLYFMFLLECVRVRVCVYASG